MIVEKFFASPVYFEEMPSHLDSVNKICDNILKEASSNKNNPYQVELNNRKILLKEDFDLVKNNGLTIHSESIFQNLKDHPITDYILSQSYKILDGQGFNLKNYKMVFEEYWVQEFCKGGYHDIHVHSNSHISGFYFLKISNKTSFPFFQDPRTSALMNKLPLKNATDKCDGQSLINLYAKPGTLVFFNSYLPHGYSVNYGVEDFRFIHFNIAAIRKDVFYE